MGFYSINSLSPLFRDAVDRLIRHPEDTSFRNLLHQRFSLLERCYNYKGVYLADTAGKVLVSLRDEVERLDRAFMPALRQGCELLSDCIFDIGNHSRIRY